MAENKKATLADGSISKLDFKNSVAKNLWTSRPRLLGISFKGFGVCKVESMLEAKHTKLRAKGQEPIATFFPHSRDLSNGDVLRRNASLSRHTPVH
jgi:hypothetical protein